MQPHMLMAIIVGTEIILRTSLAIFEAEIYIAGFLLL